jgi:uncharacterized membrane protein YgaE (UPF0421/DUF939 family)
MKIGFRTAKTVLAVIAAIYLAQLLQLNMYTFAGIVAVLMIQTTRRESLDTFLKLTATTVITLGIGSVLLWLLGYHVYVIGIMLLIIIPVLVRTGTARGIVLSAVICVHLFTAGDLSVQLLLNESLLILSGMLVALAINWSYMPKRLDELYIVRKSIEEKSSSMLRQMARCLKEEEYVWDGAEILQIHSLIQQGRHLALFHEENYITPHDVLTLRYFEMKEKQFNHLKYMVALVSRVDCVVVQGQMLAAIMEKASEQLLYNPAAHAPALKRELKNLVQTCEELPLPRTRKEFEVRAALLQILHELLEYIQVYEEIPHR